MEEVLYIKEFYNYTIIFLLLCIMFSFLGYLGDSWNKILKIFILGFAGLAVWYLGSRESSIGVDTYNYKYVFTYIYQDANSFEVRKDPFYDFLSYTFSKFTDFNTFLTFCAFIYVFGAWLGFQKIFKKNAILPFLVFIISPYFFQMGINVMRSGMASSLFLVALGVYYEKNKKWKVGIFLLLSILLHLSMVLPLVVFFIVRYIKKTHFIFLFWLIGLLMNVADINFIAPIISNLGLLGDRFAMYTEEGSGSSGWANFVVFGMMPILIGLYNVFIRKYKDDFYIYLLNAYMLLHIPYIILMKTEFALRIGYLAEFMMPILLVYPFVINPKINIKLIRFKFGVLFFLLFMVKAYKILIVE